MTGFAPSIKTYREWLRSEEQCQKDSDMNQKDCFEAGPEVYGKERARTRIAGGQVLSIPVEGGSARLKRCDCGEVMISNHGRWREVHLGALQAVYGRMPYFPYLFPVIEEIYKEKGEGSLEDFNRALHQALMRWVGVDALAQSDFSPHCVQTTIATRLSEERKKGIDEENSILDLLFRLGRESVFVLMG